MKKAIFILLIIIAGCSPQKRIARILKKNPEILKNYSVKVSVKDTIYDKDTFITPVKEIHFTTTTNDTIIVIKKDTIFKSGNSFKIKLGSDTFYKIDTIYYTKEITTPAKVIDITPKWVQWIMDNWLILALMLALMLALRLKNKDTSGGK